MGKMYSLVTVANHHANYHVINEHKNAKRLWKSLAKHVRVFQNGSMTGLDTGHAGVISVEDAPFLPEIRK